MSDYRCPNCQTDLNSTAQFCRRCGYKVSAPLVSPSATEATTRNLPNLPNIPDFRQTNNFTGSQFGQAQQPPSGNFQPQMGQQMPYMAVPPMAPRRSNGPKVLLISFVIFGLLAFGMVLALIGPLRPHRQPVPSARPTIPVSGTSYAKSFKLPADGQISLQSMSGGINVTTYDGDNVEFRAMRSDGSNVPMDDALEMNLTDNSFLAKYRGGRNANLSYDLKIPRKMGSLSLVSLSGDIKIKGVDANLKIKSTSGKVTLEDVTGGLDLETTSGDQVINFKNLPTSDLKIHSISGDVSVNFPGVPDLKVNAHTISGDIESDYPSLDRNSRPASNTLTGALGKALYNLGITTISGDIKIGKSS